MSHYQTIQSLGTPIVVHSGITQMLGSMTASALLSHIMYWSERTDNPLGFYRTLDELKAETSLSDNELRTARKLLVKLGLVVETHKRLEHRLYFKFNAQVFDDLFGEHLAKCENPHLASCEIHNPPPVKSTTGELLNPQLGSSENHSSLYTKITTKNTTKITDKECVGENPPTQQPKHTDENQTFENLQNPKSDKQTGKNSSAKKFIKPSFDEVKNYFMEKKHPLADIQAHKFMDYYDSVGWVVGKNPMKDWKAAIRSWITRDNHKPHFVQTNNRMDELRQMANTNPTNVFVDDLPPNFETLGENYE